MNWKTRLFLTFCLMGLLAASPAIISADTDHLRVKQGEMVHAQQALERYDAAGEPILQFFETWTDGLRALQREVRTDGQTLSYAYSGKDGHLVLEAGSKEATAREESPVFLLDYEALKAGFDKETSLPGQQYAKRACASILLEKTENEDDWIKVYLDDETGFVLFCEAPLFRLRTSLLETAAADDGLLSLPDGPVL